MVDLRSSAYRTGLGDRYQWYHFQHRNPHRTHHTDHIASDSDIEIASRLIINARDSHTHEFRKSKSGLLLYDLYYNRWLTALFHIVVLVDVILLPFFERPAFWNVSLWIPIGIEFGCLFIFTLRWIHARLFRLCERPYMDKSHLLILIAIVLNFLDLVVYVIVYATNTPFLHRYTRALRIIYIVNFTIGSQLKRAFKNVIHSIPVVMKVYVVFIASWLTFGFLLWNLLKNKNLIYPDGSPYFVNYGDSLFDLYIAVTTANFPDVMMPAYNYSGYFAILFLGYMIINLYLLFNITLAATYTHFREFLREEIRVEIRAKRRCLEEAFHLLKVRLPDHRQPYNITYAVNLETFSRIMKLLDPSKSQQKVATIFNLLDLGGDNYLILDEFLYLTEILNVRITEVKDRQTIFEQFIPQFYNSRCNEIFRMIIKNRFTDFVFDVLILVNFFTVLIESYQFEIQIAFWTVFLVEILLKIYVYGYHEYFVRLWNIFDLLVIFTAFLLVIIEAGLHRTDSNDFTDAVMVLRVFRVIKVFTNIKPFRELIITLINIAYSLGTYSFLILCTYYVFIMVGMEAFGDLIKSENSPNSTETDCSNPALVGSVFAGAKYCKNNFNTILNGLVLMFEFMVVNNWFVIASGFIVATSKWARIFFMLFHVLGVVVSLNVFTALFLELFWIDKKSKSTFESTMEKRIRELSLNYQAYQTQSSYYYGPRFETTSNEEDEPVIKRILKKIMNAILSVYDLDHARDVSKEKGLKFDMSPRGPHNVESLLFKMFSDDFDIRRENLLE